MYAIIVTGGKQVKVSVGDTIYVEKLSANEGETVVFDKVLLVGGESSKVGAPYVEGASVKGTVTKNGKSPKVVVFKYKAKANYRRTQGHRQPYTRVTIDSIDCQQLMIKVTVKYKANQIKSIILKGHSGYAEYGQDVVCAGASSCFIGALNALTNPNGFDIVYEEGNGSIVTLSDVSDHDKVVLEVLVTQLETIAFSYGKS